MSKLFISVLCVFTSISVAQQEQSSSNPGELMKDEQGKHLCTHGNGILQHTATFYRFGGDKDNKSNSAYVGVTRFPSEDHQNWKIESIPLAVEDETERLIHKGCIIEFPKVTHNKKTKKRGCDAHYAEVAAVSADPCPLMGYSKYRWFHHRDCHDHRRFGQALP